MPSARASVTVIIPTFNEEALLEKSLKNVRRCLPEAALLIVDGGSVDATVAIAEKLGVRVIASPLGRGTQMDAGAQLAISDVLLFLHADTLLPDNAEQVLDHFFEIPENRVATFRLSFDRPNWFLRASAWLTRIDSVFTRFGDQGIAITRKFYHEAGGFPHWPLFEDVELLRQARRRTRVPSFPEAVITSTRRFQKRGIFRQQWLNTRLLCRFLLGTSSEKLAQRYRS